MKNQYLIPNKAVKTAFESKIFQLSVIILSIVANW